MAQFNTALIVDRVAALVGAALSVDVDPIGDVLERDPPHLSVDAPLVARVGDFVRQNTWQVMFAVSGTLPFPAAPGTVQADRDTKANAIYNAVIANNTGRLLAADGTTELLSRIRCESVEFGLSETEPARLYTIRVTFVGLRNVLYFES